LGSLITPLRRRTEKLCAFFRRQRKIRRLKREITVNPAPRIVVGSSGIFEPGWVPTDADYLDLLQPADWQHYFSGNPPAAILAEHVWEHLSPADGAMAAQTCYTFLRPGGYLRLAVPDGFNPDPDYHERVRPGGTGPGADDHKVLYTHETLRELLERVGFKVTVLEYHDAAGQFHHVDWDPAGGKIHRSRRFDERNQSGRLAYTSLIVDAHKPA
jgi:predicted SAM-dependent methyltransferase